MICCCSDRFQIKQKKIDMSVNSQLEMRDIFISFLASVSSESLQDWSQDWDVLARPRIIGVCSLVVQWDAGPAVYSGGGGGGGPASQDIKLGLCPSGAARPASID